MKKKKRIGEICGIMFARTCLKKNLGKIDWKFTEREDLLAINEIRGKG